MGESRLCSEKREKLPDLVRSTDCTYLCASALNPGGHLRKWCCFGFRGSFGLELVRSWVILMPRGICVLTCVFSPSVRVLKQ